MFIAHDTGLLHDAHGLAVAVAVGLVVGLERGWRDRDRPEGTRVAGLRTFALVGLLGGVLARMPEPGIAVAAGVVALAAVLAVSYVHGAQASASVSITSAVAALVTLGLGALATAGEPILAVAAAVLVAAVLGMKDVLHRWLRRIQPAELNAVLQLGVVSAVVLPLLPDRAMGPYGALNPFSLWLAVILIASLSLVGHVAIRLQGQRKGMLWAGMLGGLASSTAATLALARTAKASQDSAPVAAAAAIAASGVMFLRMAVIVTVLQPGSSFALAVVLVVFAIGMFAACWVGVRGAPEGTGHVTRSGRLFDLPTALVFAAVLALVAVLARAAIDRFGTAGLYTVSFLSGLADVDAVAISNAQLAARAAIAPATAATAMLLAAGANLLLKAAMAWGIGGAAFGRRVMLGYVAATAVGAGAAAFASSLS